MADSKKQGELRNEVERILTDMGWEDLDAIEDWDGEDLESLREMMSEEDYESLLDDLEWEEPAELELELELETQDD